MPSVKKIIPALFLAFLIPIAFSQCTSVHMTAEQDHQRMMDVLHIQSLRAGPSGSADAPNAANYDEAKAGPFSHPPNPLIMNNGKPVTSAKMWWNQRRPQIVEAFNEDIYGRVPKDVPSVHWEVVSNTRETYGDIPVITKKLIGHVDNSGCPAIKVDIQLTLSTPANAKGAVPVMMEFDIDPAMMAAFRSRLATVRPEGRPAAPPPPPAEPSWQKQVLARGWGYASYIPTSVQADNGAALTEGIIGLTNKGQPRTPDQWGALRAWAWGASRALDYFETDKAVDAKHVGITGHSRYGKGALVTMAYDPRFAIGYISSSGEGGAKLWRHVFGEDVGNIAGTQEYHWMAGIFLKYDGPLMVNDMPVDSNELISLCAPRPVFISGGATKGDGWVDAKGMFLAAADASPVYELLGAGGLGTTEFPPMLTGLTSGALAFRQHEEGHTPVPNWPYFIDWAVKYM
jgi:hypothetical protein